MSRIGNKPIKLESGVTFARNDDEITITGPKGTLKQVVDRNVKTEVKDNELHFTYDKADLNAKQGLARALVNNMIVGVTKGWEKKLIIAGVGYKAQVNGNKLTLNLGYSHPIEVEIPSDLKVTCPQVTEILVSGIDKQRVGQFCAMVRTKRPYEPYHGYGVHAEGERLVRKVGKAAGKGKK
ncbi:MAG: 50S ribosomal protein L6 [Candidatus Caccovivens sp.]